MSDRMIPVPFKSALNWIFQEYKKNKSIFFIPADKFYKASAEGTYEIFNNKLETPLGPAAGPHTQLTQNIVTAYLSGGRFFELKTVQKLDELVIDKPCIDATDEGYNVEWSQELKIDQSYDEYVKAWIILHFLGKVLGLNTSAERGFVFNMSVGYDLAGIKTERMDRFIEELKDASKNPLLGKYINELVDFIDNNADEFGFENKSELIEYVKNISPYISDSMTLSTMHGCPPHEIEAIASYLLTEKKLNTYVKLNPTLLGFEKVSEILKGQGYNYIELDRASFDHDLQFSDAVPMLTRLIKLSKDCGLQFGVKLSNTLGVNNPKEKMPGDQMYMSGRSLYPLTINLAYKIASTFNGDINVSFSGGANVNNVADILSAGIYPVTVATVLLKPGGYSRLKQMSEIAAVVKYPGKKLDTAKLKKLAADALTDREYHKDKYDTKTMKNTSALHLYDCYDAPCQEACPVHQDVPEYIKLVEEERYNEAFDLIVSKNPLPFITGYICDHQCMFKCTRMDYDNPVLIREIKKIAAQNGYDNYFKNYKADGNGNKIKAAIIGAGPAGLAAGYFLVKAGFDVMIFDKSEKAGGVVRNVIPEFRLPQSAIDKDIDFIKLHGVNFTLGYKDELSIEALKGKGYKYVFVAIGAGKSGKFEIPGAEGKLINGIEFLWDYRNNIPVKLGKNVAVIGGGNSAMDSARAAKRVNGVENVYIIYRRTKDQMPADKEEYYEAVEDGVIFKELLLPAEYNNGVLKCTVMKLTAKGADGRRNVVPVEGEFENIEIDNIISAIGEKVDVDFLKLNRLALNKYNAPDVEETTNETSMENVFIGGDALRGPSSIIQSIADGKKAAEAIVKKEGLDVDFTYRYEQNKETRYSEIANRKSLVLPVLNESIQKEAERCLGCDLVCNKCVEVCPNRANMFIYTGDTPYFKDKFQILHLNAFCNECGNCETFCPHNGAPYKDKLTLFENELEYNESSNHGFFFTKNNDGFDVKLRIHDFEDVFTIDSEGNAKLPDEDFNEIEGFNEALVLIKAAATKYNFILAF